MRLKHCHFGKLYQLAIFMHLKWFTNHTWLRTLIFALGVGWVAYIWTNGNQASRSDCEYVNQVYNVVLDRKPDKSGYDVYCKALISGNLSKEKVLQDLLSSPEYLQKHR